MRFALIAVAAVSLLSTAASAQLVAAPDANPLGTWRGTSLCVTGTSGCENEAVVYRIALKLKSTVDSLSIDARKVVDGHEEQTGFLICDLNASRAFITCAIPAGKWRFTVRHDSLVGQLRLRDGTWVRDLHAIRSK